MFLGTARRHIPRRYVCLSMPTHITHKNIYIYLHSNKIKILSILHLTLKTT